MTAPKPTPATTVDENGVTVFVEGSDLRPSGVTIAGHRAVVGSNAERLLRDYADWRSRSAYWEWGDGAYTARILAQAMRSPGYLGPALTPPIARTP